MANPYIAMAVLLEVGLHGIENKIEAPAPIEENIYIMTAEERKEAGITDLRQLFTTLWKLWLKMRLSEQLLENISILVSLKPNESNGQVYATFVSQWEIDNYLDLY